MFAFVRRVVSNWSERARSFGTRRGRALAESRRKWDIMDDGIVWNVFVGIMILGL